MLATTLLTASILALSLPEVLGGLEPTASVDLRAESRVRPAGQVEPDSLVAGEIEVVGGVTAGLRFSPLSLAVRYAPSVTFTSYDAPSEPLILHQAMARAFLEIGTDLRVMAAHLRQFGERNFSAALIEEEEGGRRLRLEFLPEIERLAIESQYTSVGAGWNASTRREFRLMGSYFVFGGRDEAARRRLPLQSGPRLGLEADIGTSTRDALLGRVRAARTDFEPGPTFVVGELEGGWRHGRDRRTTFAGLLGVFAGYNEEPLGNELRSVVLPTLRGEMIRSWRRGRQDGEMELQIAAVPRIHQLEATLDPRISLEFGVDWSHRQMVHGRLDAGHAWVLSDSFELDGRILAMGSSLSWPIYSFFDLEGGMRLFRQRSRYGPGWWGPSQWRWDLFIALSVQTDFLGAR